MDHEVREDFILSDACRQFRLTGIETCEEYSNQNEQGKLGEDHDPAPQYGASGIALATCAQVPLHHHLVRSM